MQLARHARQHLNSSCCCGRHTATTGAAAAALLAWPQTAGRQQHVAVPMAQQQLRAAAAAAAGGSTSTSGRGGTVVAAASGYWTLAEAFSLEREVKRSRFIATAWPVTTSKQALAHIAAASDPSASHNCYAFKVAGSARSNDDGEPGGTAGKPILGAIEADGLDGVAVLVVRHFGGTKLGTGGLARAYGGAARDCLRAAAKQFVKAQVQLCVDAPFECLGSVYSSLAKFGATAGAEEYTDPGRVQLSAVTVDADAVALLTAALADATSGKVRVQQQAAAGEGS